MVSAVGGSQQGAGILSEVQEPALLKTSRLQAIYVVFYHTGRSSHLLCTVTP